MRDGADAANRKARAGFDKVCIGAAYGTHDGFHLFLIHALVTRCHHQHGGTVQPALEDDALGHLPHQNAELIGGLLRRACCAVQHLRRMRMTGILQKTADALHPFRQRVKF